MLFKVQSDRQLEVWKQNNPSQLTFSSMDYTLDGVEICD